MNKPVLIIMAAGMGSRYGKLKQLDPVDEHGHMIIDYSIYDAHLAGFETVVFVIKQQMQAVFKQKIGDRIAEIMNVQYVYQQLSDVPDGFSVPKGREKPWGTAHAVMSARHVVDSPFAVINADDYYGQSAIKAIYDFLVSEKEDNAHAMVGYKIENALTEHGYVSRGICETDEDMSLVTINERTHIERHEDGAVYIEDGVATIIPAGTFASLNLWGFSLSMMDEIEREFAIFLKNEVGSKETASEFYLPFVPGKLVEENRASVKVLETDEKWYGVTYKPDMNIVKQALNSMRENGKYPDVLWEDKH
ncbi:MAG: nucleotidyltransferase [Clostridia bacterium]|nr:nucleotidyltransferase [Clostridia bacterium]MBT7123099.1 nucleotidyltransferase [Clostridia bacterium]